MSPGPELPMWILSGIFFSSERFPEAAQPFIQILPLTPLINALRNVSLEGASLASQWPQLGILAAWGAGSFLLALRCSAGIDARAA
jgi:ABC-type polysaccharide/polyol phosphate export permease